MAATLVEIDIILSAKRFSSSRRFEAFRHSAEAFLENRVKM